MNKRFVISALTIGTWECGWQGDIRRQLYSQKDDNKIFFKSFIHQTIIYFIKEFRGFLPTSQSASQVVWSHSNLAGAPHMWLSSPAPWPAPDGGNTRHVMQRSHPNIPTPGPRSRDLSAPDIPGPCQREENEEFPHFKFNATHRTCWGHEGAQAVSGPPGEQSLISPLASKLQRYLPRSLHCKSARNSSSAISQLSILTFAGRGSDSMLGSPGCSWKETLRDFWSVSEDITGFIWGLCWTHRGCQTWSDWQGTET